MLINKNNFAATLASFAGGIAFGFTSPVIPKLRGEIDPGNNPLPYPITTQEESWVAGLFMLSATFAPFITAFTTDRIGRKRTLQIFALPTIASFAWFAFANSAVHLCSARLLMGVGIGGITAVVSMYIGEIAEDHNRGALGCLATALNCCGILFSYVVGPLLTVKMFSLVCTILPCVFLVLFTFFIPESPYYLLAKNQKECAEASLKRFRTKSVSSVQKELMEISRNVEESFANKACVLDLFRSKGLFRGFVTCMGLMMAQQLTGINAFLSYMQSIFDAAGSSVPSDVSAVVIGIVQVIMVVITTVVCDKSGRRILLLISASGSFLAQISLGVFFYLKDSGYDVSSLSWLPIASLLFFIVCFNLGYAPLVWAIMGELFPPNIKMIASTCGCSMSMFSGFVVSTFFPYLNASIGTAWCFWLFAGFCALGFVFVYFVVPETKGKSLQEIQVMLNEGKMK